MIRPGPNPPHEHAEGTYDLVGEDIVRPSLPGEVVVTPTADEIIDRVAADLTIHAENCVREFGDFHLALSGGSTPMPLYRRLMYDPNYRRIPWRRAHLWLVDERCVPPADERSNFGMIDAIIGLHADIPREQIHPIAVGSSSADRDYEHEIRETLAWREKGQDRLDYVLLGMGADGHTASLFPNTEPVRETDRLVRYNVAPDPATPERVTMTFALLNAARLISILVTGAGKAAIVERVAMGDDSIDELPIKGVRPLNGELKWYLDAPACGGSGDE